MIIQVEDTCLLITSLHIITIICGYMETYIQKFVAYFIVTTLFCIFTTPKLL